jgi:hypothetical protein
MSADDGNPETLRVLVDIESRLGPFKRESVRLTKDEWGRLFTLVRELSEPHGWKTAAAEWAKVSDWTIGERWRNQDTSDHHVGHPPLLSTELESNLARRSIEHSVIGNTILKWLFPLALLVSSFKAREEHEGAIEVTCEAFCIATQG